MPVLAGWYTLSVACSQQRAVGSGDAGADPECGSVASAGAELNQDEVQREATDRETRRAAYERDMEERLRESGNLTGQEIQELLTFECRQGPSNVEEQLQSYFLKLKDQNPTRAKAMQSDIQP